MARIERLKVGNTVVEMLGAHTDRNYFSTHAPELHVQMFGSGSVRYQTNDAYMFRGERFGSPGQVPINLEQIPDGGNEASGFADAVVAGPPAGSVVPALAAAAYDFDVTLDGGTLQTLSIAVVPTDDYDAIAALMSAQVTGGGSVVFVGGAFRVTSITTGISSTVVVAAGTAGSGGGDLFAAITAQAAGNPTVTFPVPTAGTGNWINIGTDPLTAADGLVVIPLTALAEINFIRAIVVVEGTGYLATATHWD